MTPDEVVWAMAALSAGGMVTIWLIDHFLIEESNGGGGE